MAHVVIRALQLSTWLPSNTQTMIWPGFWWANIISFELYTTLSHDEFNHPRLGEPIGIRAWHPIKSVMYTGLKHMHSHYNPGGFPRICAAPAFPPAPKRGTELDSGYSGKRSIALVQSPFWGDLFDKVGITSLWYMFYELKDKVTSLSG